MPWRAGAGTRGQPAACEPPAATPPARRPRLGGSPRPQQGGVPWLATGVDVISKTAKVVVNGMVFRACTE